MCVVIMFCWTLLMSIVMIMMFGGSIFGGLKNEFDHALMD